MERTPMETEWRCQKCETLLGIWRHDKMHLQYKKAQYLVRGKVLAVCRTCSAINEADSERPAEPVLRG